MTLMSSHVLPAARVAVLAGKPPNPRGLATYLGLPGRPRAPPEPEDLSTWDPLPPREPCRRRAVASPSLCPPLARDRLAWPATRVCCVVLGGTAHRRVPLGAGFGGAGRSRASPARSLSQALRLALLKHVIRALQRKLQIALRACCDSCRRRAVTRRNELRSRSDNFPRSCQHQARAARSKAAKLPESSRPTPLALPAPPTHFLS